MEKRPLTLRIHPEIYERIKAQARAEGIRVSNVVQNLIFEHYALLSDNPDELEQYKVRLKADPKEVV